MGFIVAQVGTGLYKIDPTTGASVALSLPSGITLSTTRRPRFAVLNQWVALTNSPNRNLVIDPEGTVRVMVPRPPQSPLTGAAGSGTGLTGSYQMLYTFIVKSADGELYMESPPSPVCPAVALTNQDFAASRINISEDSISARRCYRNTTGGTTFYYLIDLDGNTNTAFNNNLPDASLSTLPQKLSSLVAPPGTIEGTQMKIICSWKNRLFGVSSDPSLVDTVAFTEDGSVYQWANTLNAYPKGQDSAGVIGFAPLKDMLGLLKRNGVWKVSATASGTGISSTGITVQQIGFDRGGCIAPESVVTIGDKCYWLGRDGVYEMTSSGFQNISDDTVSPWFKSDTYFNRTQFSNAFARYNENLGAYELHLAAAGSNVNDRWVTFNLSSRRWYGPHKTAAFTPSTGGQTIDANGLPVALVGGTDGIIYAANWATLHDGAGAGSAIDFDCVGPFHFDNAPDIEHHWGQPSVITRIESGGTLSVIPYLGGLGASAGTTQSVDLTLGRQRLSRLGNGRGCRLEFQINTVNRGVVIYGYEIPTFEIGRR